MGVKKTKYKMLCDPAESEGRTAPGWGAGERVRSKRQENQAGRPEIEQTGAKGNPIGVITQWGKLETRT